MTLKQRRLKEEIKKSKPNDSLLEIGARAGYSKKSRGVYRPSTQKYTKRLLELCGNDLEILKRKYELVEKIGIQIGDLTNVNHSLDSRVRMQGGFKDKSESKLIHTFSDEELQEYNRIKGIVNNAPSVN